MTLLVSKLEFGDVGLAVEVSCCQGGVQATIGDTTLVINHAQYRDVHFALI